MKLPMLDQDTANHAVYGGAIALSAMLPAMVFRVPHAPLIGGAAALAFAAGKEAADYLSIRAALKSGEKPVHSVEWTDLAGTVAGGLAVVVAGLLG